MCNVIEYTVVQPACSLFDLSASRILNLNLNVNSVPIRQHNIHLDRGRRRCVIRTGRLENDSPITWNMYCEKAIQVLRVIDFQKSSLATTTSWHRWRSQWATSSSIWWLLQCVIVHNKWKSSFPVICHLLLSKVTIHTFLHILHVLFFCWSKYCVSR